MAWELVKTLWRHGWKGAWERISERMFDCNCGWGRTLMLGLDAAGKTTILYKLKLNKTMTTMPTIGFNVETYRPYTHKKGEFTVWDCGGQDKVRHLWRHYYQGTQCLIFVVDSNDRIRVEEARDELHRLLNEDELRDAILLVFANKQDLPNAMSAAEVSDELGLHGVRNRQWHVETSSATTGAGLFEGFEWLHGVLTRRV